MSEKEEKVALSLSLSQSEALVLFEFLSRFSEKEELRVEDPAEERILWDLLGLLEKQLAQPFRENYRELLAEARKTVRDPD